MAARRIRNLLDAFLKDSRSPVCVLDAERRVRFISPGMEALTGWTSAELEGVICELSASASADSAELLASTLAPTHQVMSGQCQHVQTVLPRRNRSGVSVWISFVPLLDSSESVERVLVSLAMSPPAAAPVPSITQRLHAELTALRTEFRRRFAETSFVGRSPEIRKALNQASLLKEADCGYTIVGPSGSGRRHLAKLIHVEGHHHERSFVCLDCRLLTAEQILDTLRVLRQAAQDRVAAPHQLLGTLALIDADRCPREVQNWLLDQTVPEISKVRMVAICGDSLQASVEEGWTMSAFLDLFATVQIDLPPLHQRPDDILLLSQHFIEDCRRTLETSAEGLSNEVEQQLRFYRWPGNVRELREVITDACQNCFGQQLETEDLPFSFTAGTEAQRMPQLPETSVQSLEQLMARFETDVITQTLEACQGNKAEAARRLGMTRPRFYRRLKSLGLEADEQLPN